MSDVLDAISELRESLELVTEDNVAELNDAEIVTYANDLIGDLAFINSLYSIGLENSMTPSEFTRWSDLVEIKLNELKDDEELSDQELLGLLKEIRN